MARLHTSTARGTTWRGQQSKNVPFLESNPSGKNQLKMGTIVDNVQTGHPGKRGYFNRYSSEDPPDKVTFPPECI